MHDRSSLPAVRGLACLALGCAAIWAGCSAPTGGDTELALVDLEGRPVAPFGGDVGATVFVFVRSDCPISNRYAPEVRRIQERFAPRGVDFWLVYPDPDEPIDTIRHHIEEYAYPGHPVRDPLHTLVRLTGATVTPEAAVFAAGGDLVYLGRIDDRFVDFGKARAAATTHDLVDALEATLAGQPVASPRTRAVGCFIPELKGPPVDRH